MQAALLGVPEPRTLPGLGWQQQSGCCAVGRVHSQGGLRCGSRAASRPLPAPGEVSPRSCCSSRLPQARLCPAGFCFVSGGYWGRAPGQTVAWARDGWGPEPENPSAWAPTPGHCCLPGPAARLPFATPHHGAGSPGPPARLPVLGTRIASRTDGWPASWEASLGADGRRGCGGCSGERRRLASPDGIRRGGPQCQLPSPRGQGPHSTSGCSDPFLPLLPGPGGHHTWLCGGRQASGPRSWRSRGPRGTAAAVCPATSLVTGP